ncbi:MAG: type II CAAX endopeptidase family protein [Alphaproteobacteria bacterium]
MIKDDGSAALAHVPLWLCPIALLSTLGTGTILIACVYLFRLNLARGALGWLLGPQRVGLTGYGLGCLIVAIAMWLWSTRAGFADIVVRFTPAPKYLLWALLGFAITLVGMYALQPLVSALGPLRRQSYDVSDPATFALMAICVIVGAIAEEIVFRGFGMGYLIARGLSPWLAGAIVLVIFLLVHWPVFGAGALPLIFTASVLMTVFRILSGNLTPGLLLHILNNAYGFLVVPLIWPRPPDG